MVKRPAARPRAVSAAKTPTRRGNSAKSAERGPQLLPGLRERLLLELDESEVPQRRRVATLQSITGCAKGTVRRWIDPVSPRLPDLESFARLCRYFGTDVNYLLGLHERRLRLPSQPESSSQPSLKRLVDLITSALGQLADGCEPFVMQGDDMHPTIKESEILLVDKSVTSIAGNGTYVVEYLGRTMVRLIEDRLAEGLVLRCANDRYRETVIPWKSGAALPLVVIGRVQRTLCVQAV